MSHHLSELPRRICQPEPPTGLDQHFQSLANLAACVPPLLERQTGSTGILNLLPIPYAFRPRVRDRLTLGGRTFPRKSWDFGGRDFHPACRYSCPHNRLCAVHLRLPSGFNPHATLLYHSRRSEEHRKSAASAAGFSPDHFRREITRLVSCYALFK